GNIKVNDGTNKKVYLIVITHLIEDDHKEEKKADGCHIHVKGAPIIWRAEPNMGSQSELIENIHIIEYHLLTKTNRATSMQGLNEFPNADQRESDGMFSPKENDFETINIINIKKCNIYDI
ncbi:hypothetical protein ACJX0J_007905, partial [Zea mays]